MMNQISSAPSLTHPTYRRDIDGLRAIAVLSVVFYHAFPGTYRFGFMGVDVFFVISGFLISSILFSSVEKGRFSFLDFYRRRVIRIFPALAIALGVALVAGWFILVASQFKQLGLHLAGAASFTSNFVLWRESGYFDNASETKPLLHLWSLAIEEQFYLIFPVFVWMSHRLKLNFFLATACLAILSFGVNIFYLHSSVMDFYSPLTRVWEILAGSMLAAAYPKIKSRNTEILSKLGLVLFLVGVFALRSELNFPGFWALIPVGCAVGFLAAKEKDSMNRWVLSRPVLVWVGKISYPLYLWHWILFTFVRIVEGDIPNRNFRIIFILTSILFAWLTTRFIETPIRQGSGKNRLTYGLIGLISTLGSVGAFVFYQNGFPNRDGDNLKVYESDADHLSVLQYYQNHFPICTAPKVKADAPVYNGVIRCHQSRVNSKVDLVILGDSHAEHLFSGLSLELTSKNIAYYIKPSLPIYGAPEFQTIFGEILSTPEIKTVVISALWGTRGLSEGEIGKTIDVLTRAGKKVIIMDDIPEFTFSPDRCKKPPIFRLSRDCAMRLSEDLERRNKIQATFKVLKNRFPDLIVIISSRYFCNEKECSMTNGKELLYLDRDHLNLTGSRYLAKKIVQDYPGAWK